MGAVVPGTASGTCAACHGLTAAHVASEGEQPPAVGVEELAGWTARQRSDACVGCHTDKGQTLEDDPHAGTGVSCWSCHPDQVHAGAGSLRPVSAYRNVSEFCLQCHADVAAAFRLPFHHRVLEAEMSCTDCHPLHGEAPITVVHDDEAGSCLQCHVELNGPFLFPHAGTEELGCTECHRPHGSLHDGLLAQDGNSLCLQCHFEPGFPVIAGTDHSLLLRNQARCYDCHTEVHGSDTDPTLRDR
jgi:DmsE family decaheme c-type cytochrome